jgi:hypothetical protein
LYSYTPIASLADFDASLRVHSLGLNNFHPLTS